MGCWSAENATKAYLKTMKMPGVHAKEPSTVEFISALAAGNNAQLMLVACATIPASTTLGLVAAARQTGGRIICIVRSMAELNWSINALGCSASQVEFVVGEAQTLLSSQYRNTDLVVIDCNLENYQGIFRAVQLSGGRSKISSTMVFGSNAFCTDSWRWGGSKTQLLPIGQGLLMTRIVAKAEASGGDNGRRSHWIVTVDKYTGEEHVFRVKTPHERVIKTCIIVAYSHTESVP